MTNTVFAGVLCHTVLTREIIREDLKPRELCFRVRGVELRFGDWEFGLLSGLRFGDMEAFLERFSGIKKPYRIRNKFFPGIPTPSYKDVETIMLQTVWKDQSDHDAVSFAMLYFAIGCVLDNTREKKVLRWVLELVEFPRLFNEFPWGVCGWDVTYRSLVNGIDGGKDRIDQLIAYRENLRINRVSYNLYGFAYVFQAWLLEVWDATRTWYEKKGTRIPRWLRWKKTAIAKLPKVLTIFESGVKPNAIKLTAEDTEKESSWYDHLVNHVDGLHCNYDHVFTDLEKVQEEEKGQEAAKGKEVEEEGKEEQEDEGMEKEEQEGLGTYEGGYVDVEDGSESDTDNDENAFIVSPRVPVQKKKHSGIERVLRRMFDEHEKKMNAKFDEQEKMITEHFG
ncbi:uncharacterized protein [Euphorbia lathyris]|uniref:uncharacterized protein n=1 Tax=Euphorbia lathyris TaxID=212925 RepID=UPI003313A556